MFKTVFRIIFAFVFVLTVAIPSHSTKVAIAQDDDLHEGYAWTLKVTFPNNVMQAEWWLIRGDLNQQNFMVKVTERVVVDVTSDCVVQGNQNIQGERFIFDGNTRIGCQLPDFQEATLGYFGVDVDIEASMDYWLAVDIESSILQPGPQIGPQLPGSTSLTPTIVDSEFLQARYSRTTQHDIQHILRVSGVDYTVPVNESNTRLDFFSGFGSHLFPLLHDSYGLWPHPLSGSLREAINSSTARGFLYWDENETQHVNNGWVAPPNLISQRSAIILGCGMDGRNCLEGSVGAFVIDPGARAF